MDQGRQGRDQVDAVVMPDVRRQRRAASASCAGLQSRQLHADARNTGADQGLVADEPEGEADQDRREGRAPRPLRHLPDGRGRHRTANVPRDSAADRGTTTTATTSACVRRRWSYVQERLMGGVCPNASENGQISPPTTVRAARRASSRPHLAAVLREGRKSANIQAGSGVIWRNPDKVAWSGPRAPIERRWRIQKSDEKAL